MLVTSNYKLKEKTKRNKKKKDVNPSQYCMLLSFTGNPDVELAQR